MTMPMKISQISKRCLVFDDIIIINYDTRGLFWDSGYQACGVGACLCLFTPVRVAMMSIMATIQDILSPERVLCKVHIQNHLYMSILVGGVPT